jgi:hypothetical protein
MFLETYGGSLHTLQIAGGAIVNACCFILVELLGTERCHARIKTSRNQIVVKSKKRRAEAEATRKSIVRPPKTTVRVKNQYGTYKRPSFICIFSRCLINSFCWCGGKLCTPSMISNKNFFSRCQLMIVCCLFCRCRRSGRRIFGVVG